MPENIVTPEEKGPTGTSANNGGTETVTPPADGILDGEGPASGAEGGEPKGQESTPDETYKSVKFPDGAEIEPEFSKKITAWAKEHKLAPEGLQKLFDQFGASYKAAQENAEKEYVESQKTRQTEWLGTLQKDQEFGGKNYKESVDTVRKFLAKIDPDKQFRKAASEAGVSNWPPLVKLMYRLAKGSKDDSIRETVEGSEATPANDDGKFYDELYPTMSKKSGS